MSSIVLIAVAFVASFSMAWALGASSNSPPFAPAVSANALSIVRAAIYIGVFASIGAVVQGGSVSETVGEGLVLGVSLTPLAVTAGLLTAALFIGVGVVTGYPIPSAFATTGAIIGAGLALGGSPAIATYEEIGLFWALIPVVSGGLAYAVSSFLRREDVSTAFGVSLLGGAVGAVIANIPLAGLPSSGSGSDPGTIAGSVSAVVTPHAPAVVGSYDAVMIGVSVGAGVVLFGVLYYYLRRSVDQGIRYFLIALGAIVTFSSGGTQVGLAIGPLESQVQGQLGIPTIALLGFGAVGMLLGAWTGSPRLLQAVAHEYAELGTRRSIAALIPAFLIAQVGVLLGFPISFNDTIISGVIGSGLASGTSNVSRRKIGFTVVAWVGALVGSSLVAFAFYRLLAIVAGGS